MSGVMVDMDAVILGGLCSHGGFGISQIKQWVVFRDKGTRMNCWEAMFIQAYHQDNTLITEQQVTEHNPLFDLRNTKTTMRTQTT